MCHFRAGPSQGQLRVQDNSEKEEGLKHPDIWGGILCATHQFLLSVLSP